MANQTEDGALGVRSPRFPSSKFAVPMGGPAPGAPLSVARCAGPGTAGSPHSSGLARLPMRKCERDVPHLRGVSHPLLRVVAPAEQLRDRVALSLDPSPCSAAQCYSHSFDLAAAHPFRAPAHPPLPPPLLPPLPCPLSSLLFHLPVLSPPIRLRTRRQRVSLSSLLAAASARLLTEPSPGRAHGVLPRRRPLRPTFVSLHSFYVRQPHRRLAPCTSSPP